MSRSPRPVLLLASLVAVGPAVAGVVVGGEDGARYVDVTRGISASEVARRAGVPLRLLMAANRDVLAGTRAPRAGDPQDGETTMRLRLDLPARRRDPPPGQRSFAFGGSFLPALKTLVGLLLSLFANPSGLLTSLTPPRTTSTPNAAVNPAPASSTIFGQDPAVSTPNADAPANPAARGIFDQRLPLDRGAYQISSRFGSRGGAHKGIDLAAPAGKPIYATGPAVCSRSDLSATYGNVVYLNHIDGTQQVGVQTRYAHMLETPRVKRNLQLTIAAGTVLGKVGSTGRSTGNHLHFEVRKLKQSVATGAEPRFPSSSATDPADDFQF